MGKATPNYRTIYVPSKDGKAWEWAVREAARREVSLSAFLTDLINREQQKSK